MGRKCIGFALAAVFCLAIAPAARGQMRDVNTRHYRIHTDLNDGLVRDLGTLLDNMYDEYAKRLAIFERGAIPRLEVYLFRTQRDYMDFSQGRLKNTGGVFVADQNLLAAFLELQGRDTLRRTLQHEAFHQFAFNAISPDLPIWLNEGLAQFFEEGLWNGDGLLLGEVPPRRLRQLEADLKGDRLVGFSTLLTMTPKQWSQRLTSNRADGATQYNQSWAMVHFLAMSKDVDGDFLYRPRLLKMLRLLHEGIQADQAFQQAFGKNIPGFERRFIEYARALRATPEATLIEHNDVLADLLIDLGHNGKRFDDIESFRKFVIAGRFRMHYVHGDLEWDTDPDMSHYFCDLAGRRFGQDDLYFSLRSGAPLSDIVCRCGDQLLLRTRFYDGDAGQVDHELAIEPVRASVSVGN
jgi:hypothetical protein